MQVDPSFGHWLAGLTDGEGNFDIHRQRRSSGDYYYCRFEISLRADDGAILHMLQQKLGGKVYAKTNRSPSDTAHTNPKQRWELVSRAECQRLVEVFERCPLQSKKARDFAIWKEALAVSASNAGTNRADLMQPYWKKLRATRTYAGFVVEPATFQEIS